MLEALREESTIQEIAVKHGVHPNQVSQWKSQAIDDAITSGKQLRFSHGPRKYHDCALEWEWNYIKNKLNIDEFDVDDVLIYREDGFWYVEK